MRFVLIGASPLALATAKVLLRADHEVVIIEEKQEKIDALGDELDCGMMCGDGSRPAVLKEVSPENTDVLFCLSDSDQDNIIASLVGKTLDFPRIVTKIEDPEFETVCTELGLEDVIVPDRQVGEVLADLAEGGEAAGLTAAVEGDVRFYSISVNDGRAGAVHKLDLPEDTRALVVTREGESHLIGDETELQDGDDVLLITHKKHIQDLSEQFGSQIDDADDA